MTNQNRGEAVYIHDYLALLLLFIQDKEWKRALEYFRDKCGEHAKAEETL